MTISLSEFLIDTTKETCRFLCEVLPAIGGEDWWKTRVVTKLSFQQQQRIERGQSSNLEDLDLGALVQVFIRNWYEIADKAGYTNEDRTLVHEVREIRNRVAHKGTVEPHVKDVYRDIDTLRRYLALIKADSDLMEKLEGQCQHMIALIGKSTDDGGENKNDSSEDSVEDSASDEPHAEPPRPSTKAKPTSQGVPIELLGRDAGGNKNVNQLLSEKTFVGIDFGTSTTVVSYVTIDEESGALMAEPIPITQYDELGGSIEDHLVPTCIAWTGQELLVGQGAARLKSEYQYGRNIWFSFKMDLGTDLGPQYYNTELSGESGPAVIQKPQHAAKVFFSYLREKIEDFVLKQQLPQEIIYSASVPAAFEANQRQDLCNALKEADINLPKYGIIDEPNAAFISYLCDTLKSGTGIAESINKNRRNILVFDFGAGTCDISILEVGAEGKRIISKNKAISQFHALGGDNIDRQIVRKVLLDQLFEQNDVSVDFTSNEIAKGIIPKLQQAAEDLKVQCCKYITNNWDGSDIKPFLENGRSVSGNDVETFHIHGTELRLKHPIMIYEDFAQVMGPFLDPETIYDKMIHRQEDVISIFEPVISAMGKAEMEKDDLNMVLFIGGSSLSPFVQSAVQDYFGRFVEGVVQSDLRIPVSRGTAVNSFMVNGLGCEIIKPITSEPFYVLTKGRELHEILPAGSEIPSEDFFTDDLEVQRDGQEKVELPICVTSEDKLLDIIKVLAPEDRPFKKGNTVKLKCSFDENKRLQVRAEIGGEMITVINQNPLANIGLTPAESHMLEARRNFHVSALKGNGQPSVNAMLHYADACKKADHFLETAEAFGAAERLDPSKDFATNICYYYSRANKQRLSKKWAEIAYKRYPTEISAYNLALSKEEEGDLAAYEKLMEKSLEINPECEATLIGYGHYLKEKGSSKGLSMIEKAFERFESLFNRDKLDPDDFGRFRWAAGTLGRSDMVQQIDRREKDLMPADREYSEHNLAVSAGEHKNIKRRD